MSMALIFLITGLLLLAYRLYRFAAGSGGEASSDFYLTTRRVSTTDYFTRTWAVNTMVILLVALVVGYEFLRGNISRNQWLAWLVVPGTLVLAWLMISLEIRFWSLVSGVEVTANSDSGSLEVTWRDQSAQLTPQNVTRLEKHHWHSDSRLRDEYGYVDFFQESDTVVRLWERLLPDLSFLQKHYGHLPATNHQYRLPWKIAVDVIRNAKVNVK